MKLLGQSTRMGGHGMKVRMISILVAFVLLFGPVVFVEGKGKGGGSRGAGGGGRKSGVEEKSRSGGRASAVESAKGKGKSDAGAKVKDAKEVRGKTAGEGRGKAGGAAKSKDSRAGSQVKVTVKDKAGKVKAADKAKALGKEHQKQLAALKRQVIHEEQKHLKRSARLGRIRLLAVGSGNAKMIVRIDKLILREQGRYVSKAGRMDKKKNVIMGIAVGPKVPVGGEVKVKIKAVP
jgi:hypothetical protein